MTAAPLPAENHLIDCRALHAELLDLTTQFVWQTHAPITTEEYAAEDSHPGRHRIWRDG